MSICWTHHLIAGCVVYAAMAACSADSGPPVSAETPDSAEPPGQSDAVSGAQGLESAVSTGGDLVGTGGAPGASVEPAESTASGVAGSLLASLVDPVPEAAAAGAAGAAPDPVDPPVQSCDCPEIQEPEIFTVGCDIDRDYLSGMVIYYAEVSVPGRTALSLVGTTAVLEYPDGVPDLLLDGYTKQTGSVVVADGRVAVACGSSNGGQVSKAGSVTFVIP